MGTPGWASEESLGSGPYSTWDEQRHFAAARLPPCKVSSPREAAVPRERAITRDSTLSTRRHPEIRRAPPHARRLADVLPLGTYPRRGTLEEKHEGPGITRGLCA